MQVSVRELRNRTAAVVAAVQAGESVTLTSNGEPVADIVPHRSTRALAPWRMACRSSSSERQADAALTAELEGLVGQTIDEL